MTGARSISRRTYALLGGAGVVLTALGTLVAIRAGFDVVSIVGATFALGLVVTLFLLPVHWLPATSLLILAFVPSRFIPNDGPFRALTPLTLIIVIWVFRRLVLRQGPPPGRYDLPAFEGRGIRLFVYIPAAFVLLWVLFSLSTTIVPSISISWSMSFLTAVIAPMLVPDSRAEGILLRRALVWSGAILGGYAFIEMVLQSSPIYGTLYNAIGRLNTELDSWSVYRAVASFSHPLFAAAFFTIPASLSIADWMRSGRVRDLAFAGLATLGVFATVSRGSLLAVAAAAAFVFVCSLFDRAVRVRARMLGFAVIGLLGVVFAANFGPLQERADSIEAVRSSATRDLGVVIALRTAEHFGWLGSGPGTSGMAADIYDDVIIENSALQLLVSLGVLGLLAIAALLAGLVVNALGHRDIGAGAATIALTVSFVGFNVMDAVYYLHALVGVIVLLSVSSYRHPDPLVPPPGSALHRPATTPLSPALGTTGGSPWT
ncbi:O-antigen ligase family protein [Microbacterium sp. CFBP9034]|uniref:O-antigen ligase family protein n=1 Tax=Microbacterium sp. CFBP9034 TaxID=3096540 RepID=UPI002A6AA656|nr:O-antigen ligase family protein [Microbacterium sp. CFBP9034]MDY0910379.1 hypothetical protein [Microbacterium sp. CFBP9034]